MKNSIIVVIALLSVFIVSIIILFSVTAVRCNSLWQFYPDIQWCDNINALKDEPKDTVVYEHYTNSTPKVIILTYYNKDKLINYGKKWKNTNPGYIIDLYDDDDCYKYLLDKFSKYHATVFNNIKDGPIKADYFRIHRMLEGGVYVDIDCQPFNVDTYINQFVIPYSIHRNQLNPMIIITRPNHPFILQCINSYEKFIKKIKYGYWKWSIVRLTSILNFQNNQKIPKILQEVAPTSSFNTKDYYIKDVITGKKVCLVRVPEYNNKTHSF